MSDYDAEWMCVASSSTQKVFTWLSAKGLGNLCYFSLEFSDEKWIGLCLCLTWCQVKCANLIGIEQDNLHIPNR